MGIGSSLYGANALETVDCSDISYEEMHMRLAARNLQAIDVRERAEVRTTGLLPGAKNVPLSELEAAFQLAPGEFRRAYGFKKPRQTDSNVCVYCLAGVRALKAIVMLHELGYRNVMRYEGGWEEWSTRHVCPTATVHDTRRTRRAANCRLHVQRVKQPTRTPADVTASLPRSIGNVNTQIMIAQCER